MRQSFLCPQFLFCEGCCPLLPPPEKRSGNGRVTFLGSAGPIPFSWVAVKHSGNLRAVVASSSRGWRVIGEQSANSVRIGKGAISAPFCTLPASPDVGRPSVGPLCQQINVSQHALLSVALPSEVVRVAACCRFACSAASKGSGWNESLASGTDGNI